MRSTGRYALLGALSVAGCYATPQDVKCNTTAAAVPSTTSISQRSSTIVGPQSLEPEISFVILDPLAPVSITPPATTLPSVSVARPTVHPNSSAFNASCTGCVIEAYHPITTFYNVSDKTNPNPWTSVVVTETILTQFITYLEGSTVETVVTETQTVNQTKTVVGHNQTITHTTPSLTLTPTPGVFLTVPAGPTYVIYPSIFGALDEQISSVVNAITRTMEYCVADPSELPRWQPTMTNDWNYFIETYTTSVPTAPKSNQGRPVPLPSVLLSYLDANPAIRSFFRGSKIATCTQYPTNGGQEVTTSRTPTQPDNGSSQAISTFLSTTYASTYTHLTRDGCMRCQGNAPGPTPEPGASLQLVGGESTAQSPAKSSDTPAQPKPQNPTSSYQLNDAPKQSDKPADPTPDVLPENNDAPEPSQTPNAGQQISIGDTIFTIKPAEPTQSPNKPSDQNLAPQPSQASQNQPQPSQASQNPAPQQSQAPQNQPQQSQNPQAPQPSQDPQNQPQQSQNPQAPQPSQDPQNQPQPSQGPQNQPPQQSPAPQQSQAPAGIVIGSQTLTVGQSTSINGVAVVVPSDGGGSRVVVGGSTVVVNVQPTGAPIITVGSNTVTANTQGQFVVGSETLKPGGPVVTLNGNTISLGPSGGIALVNGVTQSIGNAPIATPPPAVLTVGGQTVAPTMIGGSTQVLIGDKTLAPGSAVTVSGTTYSMPTPSPSGGAPAIIVNGITSTLTPNAPFPASGIHPILTTLASQTAYAFNPSQTLTPGGVITVSGTTYSLPASASKPLIVINGVTTSLASPARITPAPALTIDGKTYAATKQNGTTEYVLNSSATLKPGQAITISSTTYSLDKSGTALVVNGKTSSMPASQSAKTTAMSSGNSTSSTSARDVGNFVWSGLGGNAGAPSSPTGGAAGLSVGGIDKWVERLVIGAVGWLMVVL